MMGGWAFGLGAMIVYTIINIALSSQILDTMARVASIEQLSKDGNTVPK
jgi:hypothetical protein